MNAPEHLPTIGETLEAFFKDNNLGENGGLDKDWAYLKAGPVYIPFPNTGGRKRALMFHDIHHVVTGYKSNWQGEAEIGAWEVSTGCGDYYAAWVLDLLSMALGLFLFPRVTYRAFIRGQRTKNLYHYTYTAEQAKQMRIPELQEKLGLNMPLTPATAAENRAFVKWAVIALLFAFMVTLLPYLVAFVVLFY